jgi:hypothetical protein
MVSFCRSCHFRVIFVSFRYNTNWQSILCFNRRFEMYHKPKTSSYYFKENRFEVLHSSRLFMKHKMQTWLHTHTHTHIHTHRHRHKSNTHKSIMSRHNPVTNRQTKAITTFFHFSYIILNQAQTFLFLAKSKLLQLAILQF